MPPEHPDGPTGSSRDSTPPGNPSANAPGLIPVVAAVARRHERVLVALRSPDRRHGGLWEFPGGKVLEGEGFEQAVRRELAEELGVGASLVGEPIFRARDPGSPFVILFIPVTLDGEPRPLEHAQLAWRLAEELPDLPLAPSDARFVRECLLAEPDAPDPQNDSTRRSS